jgi:hypothetical protein
MIVCWLDRALKSYDGRYIDEPIQAKALPHMRGVEEPFGR